MAALVLWRADEYNYDDHIIMRFAFFFSTKNTKHRYVFEIKSVFFFLQKGRNGKKMVFQRGHSELNQGPLDLQSNALPLSYTPAAWWCSDKLSTYTRRLSLVPVFRGLWTFVTWSLSSVGKSHAIILSCKLLQPFENMEPVCNDISLK